MCEQEVCIVECFLPDCAPQHDDVTLRSDE